MSELLLEIISPAKQVFSGQIKSITVPGTKGRFQVLKNHAPIISTFDIGMIRVDLPETTKHFATAGGTIEVLDNKVLVLADSIESSEEIDLDRALRAKERAEKRLAEKSREIDVERAQAALARALNRIKIKETYND
ncbi:F0F1-type ATP synthase subunit epsilon [Ignavibacterium album JCM 16511]|uniref:ATP synthase epsilon chain n=1 Tax=Ignavibacterium album (strain DSM 19864 / JCM 16511 / NBRC 101810 / Mat9-16) TaxID=945713 RepID=I0AK40_IGNAJ|nr:F0F1 ATP synthase subunit epsilon [Ignavibacterium album]AFH49347.1 F0F1-type ATP synthase subunit epsilon [Ignavibacterium album JCM 16511]